LTGNYVLYIPHSGEYQFTVRTENSPAEHKNVVSIPSFDKPVALRQEIKLTKEGGQERLVINNFFDTPLDEDLATLAEGMLRAKAGLDVNADPATTRAADAAKTTIPELSVAKTMENAPLAAGFGEGITIPTVITDLEKETGKIRLFIKEADLKYSNGYAYAAKKQKEADALLVKAEGLRASTSGANTVEDLKKTKESLQLMKQAEALQKEAQSAIAAADAVKQYRDSETVRADVLEQTSSELKMANTAADFDAAYAVLVKEKDRQISLRNGIGTPYSDMIAKARAAESRLKVSEERLTRFRDQEKVLAAKVAGAEQAMNSAKKKSDREKAEISYSESKNELDGKRRQILLEQSKVAEADKASKSAIANAEMFKRLSEDSQLGMTADEAIALDETQRASIEMKLGAMDKRIASLEIADPQMLAIIMDEPMDEPLSNSNVRENTTSSVSQYVYPDRNISDISVRQSRAMSKISSTDPTLAPIRKMIIAATIDETVKRITTLQKKGVASLSSDEKEELDQLVAMASQLKSNLAAEGASQNEITPEQLRSTYISVNPNYETSVQAINNSRGTELSRTQNTISLKVSIMEQLQNERIKNAQAAMEESDPVKLSEMASHDEQLAAAIATLKNETTDIGVFRAAYDMENKAIIESSASAGTKLESQIALTEEYRKVLMQMETFQNEAMALTTDGDVKENIRTRLNEIISEKNSTDARLTSYKSDRQLTTAASGPGLNEVKSSIDSAASGNSLEEVLEAQEEDRILGAEKLNAKMSESSIAEQVTKNAETIKALFKTAEETESIFAYESPYAENLISKYQSQGIEVSDREKIAEIQSEIFLVESEVESETRAAKQRRLDKQAEQLYFKKAVLEIGNANAIAKMTETEFNEVQKNLLEMQSANQEKINRHIMVSDELKKLSKQAKSEMDTAAELRKNALPIEDDIEQNDLYRMAFAKEQHAISLLQQSEEIIRNIDMINTYDDQELTELRYGNSQKSSTAINASGETEVPETADTEEIASSTGTTRKGASVEPYVAPEAEAENFGMNNTSNQDNSSSNTSTVQVAIPASEVAVQVASPNATVAAVPNENLAPAENTVTTTIAGAQGSISNTGTTATEVAVANNTNVESIAGVSPTSGTSSSIVTNANTSSNNTSTSVTNATGAVTSAENSSTNISAEKTTSAMTEKTVAAKQGATSKTASKGTTASGAEPVYKESKIKFVMSPQNPVSTNDAASAISPSGATELIDHAESTKEAASATAGNTTTSVKSEETSSSFAATTRPFRPDAGAYSAEEAMGFYYNFPDVLAKDLFVRISASVYNSSRRIPIDVPMPKGIYYKVQVGAFRNDIPQNLYDEFAPVSGESLTNGITRYTAGFFLAYNNADQAKMDIRRMGYPDAFIVAYRDGKRIPIYEAMGETENDYQAAIEKEYIYGDAGQAPVSTISENVVSHNVNTSAENTTKEKNTASSLDPASSTVKSFTYASGVPNAVPALPVEATTGLFFTVQVGVYSKPVPASSVKNISPLNSELTANKKIRYTSGTFTTLHGAVDKRSEAKTLGIADAFITAYYNGQRITLSEADRLLKENGDTILYKK
ncbi:MAG: hypothetical protein IT223_01150, partial [Crocinitomicaceae bacterium]|nr:hypothetical protein [Crocinitomicaceae bacterium]